MDEKCLGRVLNRAGTKLNNFNLTFIGNISMATISQMTSISSDFGLLHPKHMHKFHVRFLDESGSILQFATELTRQVISVSELFQSKFGGSHHVTMIFEDDQENRACRALQSLYEKKAFDVQVDMLDGNERVLRTYLIKNCSVQQIVHSRLNCADSEKLTKVVSIRYTALTVS
jgi:hypothetical protein